MKPRFFRLTIAVALFAGLGLIALEWPSLQAGEEPPVGAVEVSEADIEALVEANNAFAIDLYKQLAQEEGNLFFSPYSIHSALTMTYAGARGETAAEMAEVLHFHRDGDAPHQAFAARTERRQADPNRDFFQLSVANALWGQERLGFSEPFLDLTSRYYGAGFGQVDFNQPELARQTINRWVTEQTQDKIPNLLKPGTLGPETQLVLTNAIYFRAGWKQPFPEAKTKEAEFEVEPGKHAKIPMMHLEDAQFRYVAGSEYHLLELPYRQGSRVVMVVLLPRERGQLSEVERGFTITSLQASLSKLSFHEGSVALPRFRVESNIPLAETLGNLGMPLAFSSEADFSGMVSGGGLRIGEVTHAGFISVDERGTEAAAATAVETLNTTFPQFTFSADHPFVFMILDRKWGDLLFLGRVSNPG